MKRFPLRVAALLPALVASLAVLACAGPAQAAPTLGPSGSAFYTPPSPLPGGGPGTLIWYRPATLEPGRRRAECRRLGHPV